MAQEKKKDAKPMDDSVVAGLSRVQLLELLARLTEHLQEKKGMHVPVSVFAAMLSPAEALVKYLKEHEKMRYADIARVLNRDPRGIWCTYRRAVRKMPGVLVSAPSPYIVPLSVFAERTLSVLEHVVNHLRSQKMPIQRIAELTNKHVSTIATVNSRVRRKLG